MKITSIVAACLLACATGQAVAAVHVPFPPNPIACAKVAEYSKLVAEGRDNGENMQDNMILVKGFKKLDDTARRALYAAVAIAFLMPDASPRFVASEVNRVCMDGQL